MAIKSIASVVLNNYFVYFFIFIFASACILFDRVINKKSFNFKEKFAFYFILIFFDFGFCLGVTDLYSIFLSDKVQKSTFTVIFAVLSFISGIVISFVLKKIFVLLKNKTLLSFLKENIIGIGCFLVLSVRYILCVPTVVDGWHSWCYTVDFSMGLSSRFLAGQILSIFCKDYVREKDIFLFCFFAGLVLIILTSILLNIVVKKSDKSIKPAVALISMCFVASSVSITSIFTQTSFGKLEIYGLILSLLAILLFNKIKNIPIKYIVVTLFSVISILFYQGYVFLYYNIILVAMIYDIFEKTKINYSKLVCGIISVSVSFVAFVKMQLFNKIIFNSADEMVAALSKRTDIEISKEPIRLEYFSDLKSSYKVVTNYLGNFLREKFIFQLVLLVPVIFILLFIIFKCFNTNKLSEHNTSTFNIRNILSFSTIGLIIPQFVLNVDWGRWLVALFTFICFFALYYAYKEDYSMKIVLEGLSDRIKQKPYIFVLLLIFSCIFSTVQELSFPDVSKIIELIARFIR